MWNDQIIIRYKKFVGRYIKPTTGRPVNVYSGVKDGDTDTNMFYWYQGKPKTIKNFDTWERLKV